LRGALFEHAILGRPKVSPAVTQLHPDAEAIFKDSYLVDFLDFPEGHSEQELPAAIIVNLKRLLLDLGRDFAFVGEQYLLQVGGRRASQIEKCCSASYTSTMNSRNPELELRQNGELSVARD
jgi:hypothetical protein